MIKKGDIIKHERFRDVAILVTEIARDRITGIWVNITLKKPIGFMKDMAGVDEVIIKPEDLDKWSKVDV